MPSATHRCCMTGMTQRERVSLETYRDARVGLALIREAVEDCAPPGSVAREDCSARNSPLKPRRWSAASMRWRCAPADQNRRPKGAGTAAPVGCRTRPPEHPHAARVLQMETATARPLSGFRPPTRGAERGDTR